MQVCCSNDGDDPCVMLACCWPIRKASVYTPYCFCLPKLACACVRVRLSHKGQLGSLSPASYDLKLFPTWRKMCLQPFVLNTDPSAFVVVVFLNTTFLTVLLTDDYNSCNGELQLLMAAKLEVQQELLANDALSNRLQYKIIKSPGWFC